MPCHNKIILFIFFISFCSSISLDHETLVFEGGVDKIICKNLVISTNDLVFLEDRWLMENSTEERNLKEYKTKISELDLKITYENPLYVNGSRSVKICLQGKEEIYKGVILITEINGNGGIGSWLEVYIGDEFILKETESLSPFLKSFLRYSAIVFAGLLFYLIFTIIEKRKLKLV